MTNEQQRIALCQWAGLADRWVLVKRGLYYRPKGHGYTANIAEAWVMSESEADLHSYTRGDEPVTKQRAPLPNTNSLDVLHEMEKRLTDDQYMQFDELICDLVADSMPQKELSPSLPGVFVSDGYIRVVSATAAQRREALLKTLGLWKEDK